MINLIFLVTFNYWISFYNSGNESCNFCFYIRLNCFAECLLFYRPCKLVFFFSHLNIPQYYLLPFYFELLSLRWLHNYSAKRVWQHKECFELHSAKHGRWSTLILQATYFCSKVACALHSGFVCLEIAFNAITTTTANRLSRSCI